MLHERSFIGGRFYSVMMGGDWCVKRHLFRLSGRGAHAAHTNHARIDRRMHRIQTRYARRMQRIQIMYDVEVLPDEKYYGQTVRTTMEKIATQD